MVVSRSKGSKVGRKNTGARILVQAGSAGSEQATKTGEFPKVRFRADEIKMSEIRVGCLISFGGDRDGDGFYHKIE